MAHITYTKAFSVAQIEKAARVELANRYGETSPSWANLAAVMVDEIKHKHIIVDGVRYNVWERQFDGHAEYVATYRDITAKIARDVPVLARAAQRKLERKAAAGFRRK